MDAINDDPGRDAWISAAFGILAEDGIEGVRVERIAKRLKVSKGPFYWRFADRADLLRAILQHWKIERTGSLIDSVAGMAAPRDRLEELMRLALEGRYQTIEVAKLEGAFRAWAARDPAAAELVQEVDAQRLAYLQSELRLMGLSADNAELLAEAIYLGLIGLYTARSYTPAIANDAACRKILSLALDAAEASHPPEPSAAQ